MGKNNTLINASPNGRSRISLRTIVLIGILGAVATAVMALKFPVPFAPPFYKLDMSDAIVMLGTFTLGPVAGIIIELIKVLLNFLIDGTVTMGIGELTNFLVGCLFVVPASLIYRSRKTFSRAVIGLISGAVVSVVAAVVLNYFVLIPAYASAFGMPIDTIVGMGSKINPAISNLKTLVIFATLPFNAVKMIICSLIAALLYKPLEKVINKAGTGR